MNLIILADMIRACGRAEEDSFNTKMQMLAWQTALLMNSTGNYKKKIKPTDLFNPEKHKGTVEEADISEEEKKALKKQKQEELLKTFACSI